MVSSAPRLPEGLTGPAFSLMIQGRRLRVEITHAEARYALADGGPLEIVHHGQPVSLAAGKPQARPVPAAPSRPRPSQPPGTRAGAPPAHREPGPPSPGPKQAAHAGGKPARTATNRTPHRTPRKEKVTPARAGGPAVQALRADCTDRRAPSKSAREVASRSDRRICECYKCRSVADRLTFGDSIFLTSQATGQRPGGSARRPTEDTVW
jgi:hypothetical protein